MAIRIVSALLFFCNTLVAQKISVYDLTCNHLQNPIGIDSPYPRLSWKIKATGRNVLQSAYAIRVATDSRFSKESIVWETVKKSSGESVLIKYGGNELRSGTRYYWQVRVWDANNKSSLWSDINFWETGLLKIEDWKASWIEPAQDTARHMPALMLRKDFTLSKNITSARAYVTSHGLYELYLNGKKAGDQVLTPGWTSYNKRLQYQVYDVTSMLQQGGNAIAAMLGDGWYRGTLGWSDNWAIWGKKLGLLCQLRIRYTDGSESWVITDGSWKSTQDGPIIMNGIYDGETYDARKEISGWNKTGFDDSNWKHVTVVDHDKTVLRATETVPVRKIQELKPVNIFYTPKGTLVADFGQNMTGWVKLKVNGNEGTTITLRHAEVLDKEGEFYTANLRNANATATYILKGGEEEIYEPRFTFFGFRYVAIAGYPGQITNDALTAMVIHSDMEPTGSFECSNKLINQLQHNIRWGQKGNFLDVPTDCPQRDERLGWTGDAQVFCRTAAFNMDVAAFFAKWLKDVAADQYKNGKIPFVIPNVFPNDNATSAGWGDAVTIIPWTMYHVYGDRNFLETQYASMKAYVDYIRNSANESYLWKGGSIFGDWLFYKPEMDNHTAADGYTDRDLIATAFFAYSAKLLSKTSEVLGMEEERDIYHKEFDRVKEAFNKNYVTPSGRVFSDSQTGYVLSLMFDLLPDKKRSAATRYLVEDIKRRGNHLSTGFLGTPYLCHVLSENGYTDVAYDLLLQENFPSWLYPVKMGATTIWERWDGQKTDSTFQDENMNSFNHYAYGAIGDWMYQVVAGIRIGKPGYKHIVIQPQPDKRLEYAHAAYESSYGKIQSGWKKVNGKLIVEVTVPPNTTATITLPGSEVRNITENGKQAREVFENIREQDGNVIIETGSGSYVFEYTSDLASVFDK